MDSLNRPEQISEYRGYRIFRMPDGSYNCSRYRMDGRPRLHYHGFNSAWSVKTHIDEMLQP